MFCPTQPFRSAIRLAIRTRTKSSTKLCKVRSSPMIIGIQADASTVTVQTGSVTALCALLDIITFLVSVSTCKLYSHSSHCLRCTLDLGNVSLSSPLDLPGPTCAHAKASSFQTPHIQLISGKIILGVSHVQPQQSRRMGA